MLRDKMTPNLRSSTSYELSGCRSDPCWPPCPPPHSHAESREEGSKAFSKAYEVMPLPSSPDHPLLRWAHLPLVPVGWLGEEQFQGQDPGSQSSAAEEILLLWPHPLKVPWRSSDFLPSTNRNYRESMCLGKGKGVKGTNV